MVASLSKTQKVFGISGWKNSGKTTLTSALIAEFTKREFTVSSVKHAHHEFDVDQEGTDSFKHRKSGAQEVMLSSSRRFALMHEIADEKEPDLNELLTKMMPVDLILIEGFKSSNIPKIQTIRTESLGNEGAQPIRNIIAYASDIAELKVEGPQPVLDINNIAKIADFIAEYLELKRIG